MKPYANFGSSGTPPDAPGLRTSLSVCVAVYNEQYLVETSLRRLQVLADSPLLGRVQVIVVDDCSRDETPLVLERFRKDLPADASAGRSLRKRSRTRGVSSREQSSTTIT